MAYYAHSANQHGHHHDLVAHLKGVAAEAARFAEPLSCAELGRYLGLWHDVGKFAPAWQDYLLDSEAHPDKRAHGPDHKAAGALLARQHAGLAALLVHGHHGGLQTRTDVRTRLDEAARDPATLEAVTLARDAVPDLEPSKRIQVPLHVRSGCDGDLFLRLLFSALVDADYLDTERHARAVTAAIRTRHVEMAALWERFEEFHRALKAAPARTVNDARRQVYESCLAAADSPPGMFRLAVPTGGGKTLSAMAFALRHAMAHGQRRVIVAVPFITITEQTADVYRRVFERTDDSSPVVLEHHSGSAIGDQEEGYGTRSEWSRLAVENWDSPVVVTTTVQLFESLFSVRPSAMRKLHRLARSVIILDEAQALPTHLLTPILDALRGLCEAYGTTVVISTATQPAFETIPAFRDLRAHDIVGSDTRLYDVLRRVNYEWRTEPALPWDEVAEIMGESPQSLAVVNTKRDAMTLLDALDDPQALHLSTLLCGAHRRRVIETVRRRLSTSKPCHLVSTQVIEAGVDLDFPLALRALGPLDAVVQTAGRCNREGRLQRGKVIVFQPSDGGIPRTGTYRMAAEITRSLLGRGNLDPDDPAVMHNYFQQLLQLTGRDGTDRERIQDARTALDFPAVAERFRMIDEATESAVVTSYGSEAERKRVQTMVGRLRRGAPNARSLLRRLQPYIVSLYRHEAERYRRDGLLAEVIDGVSEWRGRYDDTRGIVADQMRLDELVV